MNEELFRVTQGIVKSVLAERPWGVTRRVVIGASLTEASRSGVDIGEGEVSVALKHLVRRGIVEKQEPVHFDPGTRFGRSPRYRLSDDVQVAHHMC